MSPTRKQRDAEPLPAEAQPAGSGAVPGSAQGEEELYTGPGAYAVAGEKVQPGVNDGTQPVPSDAELGQTEADQALAEAAEEPMVTFHGEATVRTITSQEWANAGVANMPTVTWERRTGHKVSADVFDAKALQVLRQDPDFRVP